MLSAKYPTEQPEYEQGHLIDSGWHWSQDERLLRVHKRLVRLIVRSFKLAATQPKQKEP